MPSRPKATNPNPSELPTAPPASIAELPLVIPFTTPRHRHPPEARKFFQLGELLRRQLASERRDRAA